MIIFILAFHKITFIIKIGVRFDAKKLIHLLILKFKLILFFILIRSAASIHIQSDNDALDKEELAMNHRI